MIRQIQTRSGTTYWVTTDGLHIKRVNSRAPKRGDGIWLDLVEPICPESLLGQPLVYMVPSLNHLGPDDHGTPQNAPDADPLTYRVTSTVVYDSYAAYDDETIEPQEIPA